MSENRSGVDAASRTITTEALALAADLVELGDTLDAIEEEALNALGGRASGQKTATLKEIVGLAARAHVIRCRIRDRVL